MLCTTGDPVTLEGVRLGGDRQPLTVEPWLVSDTPEDAYYSTFGSVAGSPPDFAEPYARAGDTLEGTYSDDFAGTVVESPCPGGDTKNGYTEVVLAVQTDAAGAQVPFWWLDYSVGEEKFALRVDWTMIFCGNVVKERCSS